MARFIQALAPGCLTARARWDSSVGCLDLAVPVPPDAHYDEFVLRGLAPLEVGPAWFLVHQLCETGEWRWADIPSSENPQPRAPAARLDVTAPDPHAGHKH